MRLINYLTRLSKKILITIVGKNNKFNSGSIKTIKILLKFN